MFLVNNYDVHDLTAAGRSRVPTKCVGSYRPLNHSVKCGSETIVI